MKHQYIVVEDLNGEYHLFRSTFWAAMENHEEYEVVAQFRSWSEAKAYMSTISSLKLLSIKEEEE